jgi:putative methyltransferase (TIGR04325 family)
MAVVTRLFPDFQSAQAACGQGYQAADIADVIAYKAALPFERTNFVPEQALNSIVAVAMAGSEIAQRPLRVLDLGGGCGFHYFMVQQALNVPLRWAVVETPVMADRAAKVANGRFETFTEIEDAAKALGQADLIHASSSIQYVPNPVATLRQLAALRAPLLIIARLPLWHRAQTIGLQTSTLAGNGIGPMPPNIADRQVEYPVTFANFGQVIAALAAYDMAMVFASPSAQYVVQGQPVAGVTAIFRLKHA